MTMLLFCAAVAAAPVWQMDEKALDEYLARQSGGFAERLRAVVLDSVGTPYFNGPLGEGPGAKYDPDPLMDHTRVDCVTFCEQSIALAASGSYRAAHELLQQIRYRGGKIDFETRNHFMIADWVGNNRWCRDVTQSLGVETAPLTRTEDHADFFKRVNAPGLGADMKDTPRTIHYVPVDKARAAEAKLTGPALVLFVGKKPDWLFTLHTGLFLADATGRGTLFHASSKEGKVVAMGLAEYVESQRDRFLGFTAYALDTPASGRP